MKLEKIEDLLQIDTDSLKSPEKSRLLTRIKQLIKTGNKKEVKEDEIGASLPYEGVGVVGPYLVDIKFDLDSKEARVMNINKDARDIKRNYMAGAAAMSKIQKLIKEQKEIVNE